MARVPQLKVSELTERQLKIATLLGGTRGGGPAVNGPWGLLLRNVELCERAEKVGTMLRDGTSLDKRISELAIAIVARHWTAQFEWNAHAPQGIRAGLSPAVIDAIRLRKKPVFDKADEAAAYDYVTELIETKKVGDKTYEALKAHIGEAGVIELTAVAGFYALVAMLIKGLDVPLREGMEPQLPE